MERVCLIALVMLLGGCGVAATGAATTATAESAAQDAAQAPQTEERIREQIGAAEQQAADQRRAAEADGH